MNPYVSELLANAIINDRLAEAANFRRARGARRGAPARFRRSNPGGVHRSRSSQTSTA